jgi:MFS family permease
VRRVHPARYDAIFVAPIILMCAAPIAIAIMRLLFELGISALWLLAVSAVLFGALRAFLWPVTYTLRSDVLELRAGWWYRRTVPTGQIFAAAKQCHNLLFSGAGWLAPYLWSRHYLELSYRDDGGDQFVLIAPRDFDTFLGDLAALQRDSPRSQ